MFEIDKKNKGFFTLRDLATLLTNTGFKQDTQDDLIAQLQELDDDADGFIKKEELAMILSTIGEGLEQNELSLFMELAAESKSGRSDLVDIKRIAEILLPDVKKDQFQLMNKREEEEKAAK